jgi:hypothetical protein
MAVQFPVKPVEVPQVPKAEVPAFEEEVPEASAKYVDVPTIPEPVALEMPKFDAPKVEMKAPEMPKLSAPKFEMKPIEVPKIESPKIEVPDVEVPKYEAPKMEISKPKMPKYSQEITYEVP